MGFGPPEGDPEVQLRSMQPQSRRHDIRPARRGGSYFWRPLRNDPFMHQEMIEILYHTLWETVHVFFEHRELGHDVGDAGFLYPVPGSGKTGDRAASVDEVAAPSG
jgi:D-sedoheptulose 7-phosphate isomerase